MSRRPPFLLSKNDPRRPNPSTIFLPPRIYRNSVSLLLKSFEFVKNLFALLFIALLSQLLSAQKPDLFILSVGVEQYQDARLNLNFCADDARDLAAALSNQNLLYNIHTPKVLTDAQASRAAVRTALSELEREVTTDDLFVFIFSGHGIEDQLVPYDFNMADPDASTLSKTDLLQRINKLGCGYLLYIDACHSGSFAKSLPGKDILQADAGLNSRVLVDALAGSDKPYLIFGSSGSDQKSWECSSCGHGYFAQTMLDALQNKVVTNGARRFTPDADSDGYISPYEIDYYIKEAVRVNTAQEETPQKVYSRLTMGANFPLFSVPGARTPTNGTQPSRQPSGSLPDTRSTTAPGSAFANAGEPLNEMVAYEKAKVANTTEAYQQYLNVWPNGRLQKEAIAAIADLKKPAATTDPMAATLVLVKGGTFTIGCLAGRDSNCFDDEKRPSQVTLSSFYMGQTEVTQAQWREIMGKNPSYFKNCDDCPVEQVSWNDVQDFLSKLNNRSGGAQYRLPTEAEWEYAARGGQLSRGYTYAGSNQMDDVAWYVGNADKKTRPVKSKKPNEFGLYDMSGNVWEWCSDWYDFIYQSSLTDPIGPKAGFTRVNRGGSIRSEPRSCRAASRGNNGPGFRDSNLGFRLARTL
jgi:formylglycine-generating enzyme required for sulfatase activity